MGNSFQYDASPAYPRGKNSVRIFIQAPIPKVPVHYHWRTRDFQLLKSKVSYIRLIRKRSRITLTANGKFLIGNKYKLPSAK